MVSSIEPDIPTSQGALTPTSRSVSPKHSPANSASDLREPRHEKTRSSVLNFVMPKLMDIKGDVNNITVESEGVTCQIELNDDILENTGFCVAHSFKKKAKKNKKKGSKKEICI